MANLLYPTYKALLLNAGINLATSTIKVQLVDTGAYTYSAAHDFLDDVPSGARIGTPVALASKTTAGGVFDAADVTFAAVPAGSSTASAAEALIIYNDSPSTEATKNLIAYIDAATGLPVTPNGGDITVTWDNGASKIFAL